MLFLKYVLSEHLKGDHKHHLHCETINNNFNINLNVCVHL